MKFFDFVKVSVTCKRFFLISKAHKKLTETITFSKCIIKFDGYYTEFLQNWLSDLEFSLHKKINEELRSDVFSIININIKKISYELTPFKIFCDYFFCTRGSRSVERCLICSRMFVDDDDVTKKIEREFVVTKNYIINLNVFLLMKHLNTRCVVLNIYYPVGNYSSKAENSGEVFYELENAPFGVCSLYLQIYLRVFFNLIKLITEVVTKNC